MYKLLVQILIETKILSNIFLKKYVQRIRRVLL